MDNISGLRQQILANAWQAFPSLVQDHILRRRTKIVRADELFDVVIVTGTGLVRNNGAERTPGLGKITYQARLTYGEPSRRTAALQTRGRDETIEGALLGLLEATAYVIEKKFPGPAIELEDLGLWQIMPGGMQR